MRLILTLFTLMLLSLDTAHAQDDIVDQKLQQLAKKISDGIKAAGKAQVTVTDLTDLQSLPTELGKFLAVELQGNLVDEGLRVVNRERFNELLEENKLTAKGLLDQKNAAKLKNATGIQVIIIGTTTPLDKMVNINLLAIDLEKAEAVASAKTSIPRTQSIDMLIQTILRNNSDGTGRSGVVARSEDARTDSERALPKNICNDRVMGMYGMYCFENRLNEPLLLYEVSSGNVGIIPTNILIAPGASGCSPMLHLGSNAALQKNFYFRTKGEASRKGFVTLSVEGCKEKRLALTPSNFNLQ